MRRLVLVLSPLLLAASTAFAADSTPAPSVGYIVAQREPVYASQTYTGRITSPQIVQIPARVTGFLVAQSFKDGQAVKAGDLLYVIEQPPYQAQVDQAKATVLQAQAQARNAELTLARDRALLHTAAGQQSLVDQAQATAQADEAMVLSAQAQLKTAQINLSYTEIRAPFDGKMGATNVNVGNVVGPNSGPLATLVSINPMYVGFAVPAVDALKYRAHADQLDLLVQLPDGKMYNENGKIDFFNNQVTASTDTVNWRGTINNSSDELTDGEFINVVLKSKQAKQQIVLPLAAIITDQLGNYVLTVDDKNVVQREVVTLGPEGDTTVPVISGVKPGDHVIVDGLQRIHPGLTVTPTLQKVS